MAIELNIPVGGVIPYLGHVWDLDLPDNYMVLDGDTLKTLPTESPFKDKLNLLPNMNDLTFHAVSDDAKLLEDKGSDKIEIPITTENLPSDYGFSKDLPENTAYGILNNMRLTTEGVSATNISELPLVVSGNSSVRRYPDISRMTNIDQKTNVYAGTGAHRVYAVTADIEDSFVRTSGSHRHQFAMNHVHNITPIANSSVTKTLSFDFGKEGNNTPLEISTSPSELSHAKCKFIIRLW